MVRITVIRVTKILLSLFICFSSVRSQVQDTVRIVEASSTGRTIKINQGNLEGVSEGELGDFLMQTKDGRYYVAARGEVKKTYANSSLWYLYEVFDTGAIKVNEKSILIRSGKVLKGRAKLKVKRRKVVFEPDSKQKRQPLIDSYLEEFERGMPETIIKNDEKFAYGKPLKQTKSYADHDVEILDFYGWKQTGQSSEIQEILPLESFDINSEEAEDELLTEFDVDKNYESLLKKRRAEERRKQRLEITDIEDLDYTTDLSEEDDIEFKKIEEIQVGPQENLVQNEYKEETFDLMVKATEEKANDPDYDIEDMFSKKWVDDPNKHLVLRRTYGSSEESLFGKKKKLENITEAAREKLRSEGQSWSDDFSDAQLRRFIVTNGLDNELKRQEFFRDNSIDHEIFLTMHSDIVDKTTVNDDENKGLAWGYSFGYELQLMRFFQGLKRFSIDISYTSGINSYDFETYNMFSDESSWGVRGKWYVHNYPSSIEKYQWYLGAGIRKGSTVLTHPDLLRTLTYDLSVPSFEFGIRYRWKKNTGPSLWRYGLGAQTSIVYETVNLSSNQSTFVNASQRLNDNKDFTSVKINFGLGVYF